ncbi:MAG: flavin-containing monooxygenase [Gammaproteobacteria bacterium]
MSDHASTNSQPPKRIAVIGAGISGIAVARILKTAGHDVVMYEKSHEVGGIWATTYPRVSLQNTREHYFFSDFNYPQQPDLHPTGEQIERYLKQAIDHFGLDVRYRHEIVRCEYLEPRWSVTIASPDGQVTQEFDFLVVATGQYNAEKPENDFPGAEKFTGTVLTEIDVDDLNVFDNKRVAVVGFGKSAVDMAVFAHEQGAKVDHIFRTARWLLPFKIFGVHYAKLLFNRASTSMMPSWAHSSGIMKFVHCYLPLLPQGFWAGIRGILKLRLKIMALKGGPDAAERLRRVTPTHSLLPDLRSALALAPINYYAYIASGAITPHHTEVKGFDENGLLLSDGSSVPCDAVVLSTGSKKPAYKFLAPEYRELIEREPDGTQLYRHMLHPGIPSLAFAGLNHGFMHVPSAEVGALWLCELLDGRLELPSEAEQLATIEKIRQWKRDNIHFEPSRSCAVNTRFQQYNDIILKDLGINPYRKMPNVFAELFGGYGADDYSGLVNEFFATKAERGIRRPLDEAT